MIDALYTLLKSFGFDEPLHAPITHVPIGLVVGALIFFVVALIFNKKQLIPTARHAAILAFVFAFPTILLGVFDWMHFYRGILMPAIAIKIGFATVVLVVLGAAIILGGEVKLHSRWLTVLYAIAFVAVMGLGYFGSGIIRGRAITMAPATTEKTISASGQAVSPEYKRGQAIFTSNCISCHGNGANAIVASLPIKGSSKLASLEKFAGFVRKPTMPDGSAGEMPTFTASQVTEAQMADLYAYVTKAWQ
ncbi:MAG: cytochrome c [Spirochaetota bacterium]